MQHSYMDAERTHVVTLVAKDAIKDLLLAMESGAPNAPLHWKAWDLNGFIMHIQSVVFVF